MKKSVLILFSFIAIPFFSSAQNSGINSGLGLGFQLVQYQKDFGLGINVSSPYFVHKTLTVRAKANIMWNEHFENNETTWSQYSNVSLGIASKAGEINDFMRVYGEGGVILLMPNSSFSSEDYNVGGYGLFGFEFFFFPNGNYFIELGGMGTGARADEVLGKPIYSNGFMTNVGFRYQF